jgi:hypothetical protein
MTQGNDYDVTFRPEEDQLRAEDTPFAYAITVCLRGAAEVLQQFADRHEGDHGKCLGCLLAREVPGLLFMLTIVGGIYEGELLGGLVQKAQRAGDALAVKLIEDKLTEDEESDDPKEVEAPTAVNVAPSPLPRGGFF